MDFESQGAHFTIFGDIWDAQIAISFPATTESCVHTECVLAKSWSSWCIRVLQTLSLGRALSKHTDVTREGQRSGSLLLPGDFCSAGSRPDTQGRAFHRNRAYGSVQQNNNEELRLSFPFSTFFSVFFSVLLHRYILIYEQTTSCFPHHEMPGLIKIATHYSACLSGRFNASLNKTSDRDQLTLSVQTHSYVKTHGHHQVTTLGEGYIYIY